MNIPKSLTEKVVNKYFPTSCTACPIGNLSKRPLKPNIEEHHQRIESNMNEGNEIEIDIQGPWTDKNGKPCQTFNGCLYSLLAACTVTGYAFGQLLRTKGYLLRSIKHIHNEIKSNNKTLKAIRCDSAFVVSEIKEYCIENKIEIKACVPHEHDTLPRVERLHKTFRESVVKALSNKNHITEKFWGMCFHDALIKYNTIPNHKNPTTTPYIQWYGKKFDLLNNPYLPFGTIVMAHIPLEQQTALSGRSFETYYVGCAPNFRGGILLFDPITHRTIIRRTYKVMGDKLQTPLELSFESLPPENVEIEHDNQYGLDDAFDYDPNDLPPLTHSPIIPIKVPDNEYVVEKILGHKGYYTKPSTMKFLVKRLGFDHSYNSWISWDSANELAAMDIYEQNNPDVQFPETKLKNTNNINLETKLYPLIDKSSTNIPRSVEQATRSQYATYWQDATNLEIQTHNENNAWKIPDIPIKDIPKDKIIPSKIKYDIQFNPDDTLKKFKARLLLRGDKWYDEHKDNYAATVDMDIIKLLLAIAAEENLDLESVDIRSAFQTAPLRDYEKVYVRRPKGLTEKDMPAVVQLKSALNGLPQASARFRQHMDTILRSFGCVPTSQHPCVYILEHDGSKAYIPVFVDDIGMMSKDKKIFEYIKKQLSKHFTITVNADMNYYLGMHIIRDRKNKSIDLYQTKYVNEIMEKFNIDLNAKSYPTTPLLWEEKKDRDAADIIYLDEHGITKYQSKVGSLLHLAKITRNDILYAVSAASRMAKAPTTRSMKMVDRILQYVAGTRNLGIRLHSGEGIQLYATVDSSYASHTDSKSHTGVTLHIGRTSGSFNSISKKQPITADSSTVAEFIGCHMALKLILSTRIFLEELGFPQKEPTILYQDNLSTIAMIYNPAHSKKTRHLEVRFNMIREHVKDARIRLVYLPTETMTSDILTKGLMNFAHERIRPRILGM